MAFPFAERCFVERIKILKYLLDLSHAQGRGKAKFFLARGFSQEHWELFADALKQHAERNIVAQTTVSDHGTKYLVTCHVTTPDRSNPCIHSVWIDEGDHRPRLVTAHPR